MSETAEVESEIDEASDETQVTDGEQTSDAEVEIVLEGDEPSPKPVPKGFLRRINKLNARVDAKSSEAEQWRKKYELAEEQKKLLLAANKSGPPKLDDFDTDAEYESAKAKYDADRIEEIAARKAEEILNQSRQNSTQQQQVRQIEKSVREHYARAEELKLKDYDDVEDKAIEILGDELTKQIMANTDKSELIMYHLGKNPGKAQALADAVTENPVKAVLEIGRLESSLKIKPKHSPAPDPEESVKSGDASGREAWERKIEKMRNDVQANKIPLRELLDAKKQARAEGHNVR